MDSSTPKDDVPVPGRVKGGKRHPRISSPVQVVGVANKRSEIGAGSQTADWVSGGETGLCVNDSLPYGREKGNGMHDHRLDISKASLTIRTSGVAAGTSIRNVPYGSHGAPAPSAPQAEVIGILRKGRPHAIRSSIAIKGHLEKSLRWWISPGRWSPGVAF